MKVACDKCGKLVDEKQAVKVDRPTYELGIMGRPGYSCPIGENQYFKVCVKCYRGKK